MEDCPICGAGGTNCAGPNQGKVRVIGANIFPSLRRENMVIVEHDVWVERDRGRGLTSRVRIARAGDAFTESEAIRRGISIT